MDIFQSKRNPKKKKKAKTKTKQGKKTQLRSKYDKYMEQQLASYCTVSGFIQAIDIHRIR